MTDLARRLYRNVVRRWREPRELARRNISSRSVKSGSTYRSKDGSNITLTKGESTRFRPHGSTLEIGEDTVGAAARAVLEVGGHQLCLSVVPWECDDLSLNVRHELGKVTVLGIHQGRLLYIVGDRLLRARRLRAPELLARLPVSQPYRSDCPLILQTPAGFVLRTDGAVLTSPDLRNWSLDQRMEARCMFNGLTFLADGEATFVFTIEYSTDGDHSHGLWRGTYRPGEQPTWEVIHRFSSSASWRKRAGQFPWARHLHFVVADPSSGLLWIGTGDADHECGIWVSGDFGDTIHPWALGSQEFRSLSLWFTERFMYWNMDTHKRDQAVFRCVRPGSVSEALENAPTEIVDSGSLTPGVEVLAIDGQNLPDGLKRGHRWTPETQHSVTPGQRFARTRPQADTRVERVAILPHGTQWYTTTIHHFGAPAFLMSVSPESQVPGTGERPHRDWNCRLFLMSENERDFLVQEVLCGNPSTRIVSQKQRLYNRIDPRCADTRGRIYLMAHNSVYEGAVLARLGRRSTRHDLLVRLR